MYVIKEEVVDSETFREVFGKKNSRIRAITRNRIGKRNKMLKFDRQIWQESIWKIN